jgi:hypothetical protein
MAHPTDRLIDWAVKALELGFDCIAESDHAPFALISQRGTEHLIEFKEASGIIDEELVNVGKRAVRASFADADIYAVVWDGCLTADDKKHDAIFAEAGERGSREAFVFAQKYRPTKGGLKHVDKPMLVTTTKHLLKGKSSKK